MFSGIVKIADIDDYITPSQSCIKPILDAKKIETTNFNTKIKIENNYGEPDLILKDKNKKTAKISLNDCLACNGCVTTAETLLIQAQSVDEFLKNSIDNSDKLSVVCISPQSVLSLAEYFSLSDDETFKRLCHVFHKCGVQYVLNFNTATNLTLLECYKEFKLLVEKNKIGEFLISSECPGWICYAEKKVGEWIIPHLSKVKSPQQILGHLVKKIFTEKFKKEVYLTCIMPCFDKKLEATRETHRFKDNLEVDSVISTVELLELFSKLNFNFEEEIKSDLKNLRAVYLPYISLIGNDFNFHDVSYSSFFSTLENYSSNGYSEFFISEFIKENSHLKFRVERKLGKNSDYKELFLYSDDGLNNNNNQPILSFCLIYGFRNIQNLLRNKNKIKYTYLEVMACPGGCINGGGQMRPKNESETPRDILKRIELKFNSSFDQNICESQNLKINEDILNLQNLYDSLFNHDVFYTEFKALDKNETLNLKW